MEARPKYYDFLKEWSAKHKITSFFGSDKSEFLADWNNVKTAGTKKIELKTVVPESNKSKAIMEPEKNESKAIPINFSKADIPKAIKIKNIYEANLVYYGRVQYVPQYETIKKNDYNKVTNKEITKNILPTLLKDYNETDYKEITSNGKIYYFISNSKLWDELEKIDLNNKWGDKTKVGTYILEPIYKAIQFNKKSISGEKYAAREIYNAGTGKKYASSGNVSSDMANAVEYASDILYPLKPSGEEFYYIFKNKDYDENEMADKFNTIIDGIHNYTKRLEPNVNKFWKQTGMMVTKDIKIYDF